MGKSRKIYMDREKLIDKLVLTKGNPLAILTLNIAKAMIRRSKNDLRLQKATG
jgi:hypothetical protein